MSLDFARLFLDIFDALKLIFTCSATKMKTLFMWMDFHTYFAFLLYAFQMDSVFNVSMNQSFDHKKPKNMFSV